MTARGRIRRFALLPLLALFAATAGRAEDSAWDVAANIDLQSRWFVDEPRWAVQDDKALQLALAASAEFRWRDADGGQRASIIPYARWDQVDAERSLVDLPEFYWAVQGESHELLLGINTVFWGVTESVHLVDIINQTDALADIDGEAKLGQPMLNIALQRDWGMLGLYVLPYFRERSFAGNAARLRAPLPVDTSEPVYEASDEERHIDLALRYSHNIGDIDIGISLFDGTSRDPRLLPNDNATALLPYYDQIVQMGIDLQYTHDAWLWKFEAIQRDAFEESFAAAVGGFEYTFYQLAGSAADLGVLLEYQYDGRGPQQPVTFADNDLFAAARFALNDMQDTTVLAGIGYDLDTHARFINIEAERRIGESHVIELRARIFSGGSTPDISDSLASDDYLQVQLSRFF